jgi:hypothetical protein
VGYEPRKQLDEVLREVIEHIRSRS